MINQNITFKMQEKNADMLTPVSIFKRLKGTKKFLLESSFQHSAKGNYSYVGADPYAEITGNGNQTTFTDLKTKTTKQYNINVLDYFKTHFPMQDDDLPLPFTGGAIGYTAYDAIREYTDIGEDLPDEIETPDHHFMLYQTIIAYEHRTEKAYIITNNINGETDEAMKEKLQTVSRQLDAQIPSPDPEVCPVHFKPQLEKTDFIGKVQQAKNYIENNQATQIVLSQRMIADFYGDAFSFYRYLRSANPSPYMFYIDFSDYLIIGASPESLVQTNGEQVITNPIAGTRPRGATPAEDKTLESELLNDPKEISEHEMLVDLSKNDFSPICNPKSIQTPVYKQVMHYEHVMHIVSEVHGTLAKGKTSFDALIACLPAGTVSGAPKERAMQIINELEEVKRGFYAGGIGYIGFNHDMNIAIAIRSILIKDKTAYLQAGAGIVADSIPEKEYEETLHKAKSLTDLEQQFNSERIG